MIASENAILIKPTVDASNTQLHYANNFRFAAKNFDKFMSSNDPSDADVFRPSQLGKLSKNVNGIKVNIKNANAIEPDFTRNMYGDCGRVEELEEFRRKRAIEKLSKASANNIRAHEL
jgi:hypothetical protein